MTETEGFVPQSVKPTIAFEVLDQVDLIAAQLYDLARMSTRPLEKEEITAFLKRSHQLLGMIKP